MAAPADTAANHDLYLHIRTIISLVIGLSITHILGGLARIVQHPGKVKLSAVHLAWTASILLSSVHFWWWEFRLTDVSWTFVLYVFVIAYASLFYFLSTLLFPADMAEYDGFGDFFTSRRKWFFGLLALTYVADVVDTGIKGQDYLAHLGWEAPARAVAYVLLCLAAMFIRNLTFQRVFAVANLAYQVSFILRLYNSGR